MNLTGRLGCRHAPLPKTHDGLVPKMAANGSLLTVDYVSSTAKDVEWKVFF
jgi:hypothetical protein